LDNLDSPRVHW